MGSTRIFWFGCCLSWLLAAAHGAQAEPSLDSRPNVILFVVDDMGWRDPAFMGSRFYLTPAMDAMAAGGMVFTQAYSDAPNCAPTRASLMTGRATPRHGVLTVASSSRGKAKHRRLIPIENQTVLPDGEQTLAELLGSAGYDTWHLGKWHLGKDPRTQGFDVNVGGNHTGSPRGGHFSPYKNQKLLDGSEGEALAERLTTEAINLISGREQGPFFMHFSHYAVHTPVQARPEEAAVFAERTPDGDQKRPDYAALLASVDRSLGRLMACLKEQEIDEQTIVILISDNGGHGPSTSMLPLRGTKGMLYEGGIRVPMVVRYPGHVKPGSSDLPVLTRDLYPSLAALVGAPKPQHELDGADLSGLWLGASAGPVERSLYWHFPCYLAATSRKQGRWRTTPVGALRRGRWKLLEFFEDGHQELYDLAADPGESRDLSAEQPELIKQLGADLARWREQVGGRVPMEPEPAFTED
ncbi:MAG: arylsulfatase A-like enzyme [Planctomycetota bacterium]|jgi:arylsulfatase A-like enzyme